MIESIIGILTIGFLLGAPAGFSPGPMMVLIIAETLRHGIRAGAKVAFMPLLTDAPVLLVSGFLFTKISNVDFMLGVISMAGAAFLIYLGVKGIKNSSNLSNQMDMQKSPRSILNWEYGLHHRENQKTQKEANFLRNESNYLIKLDL